MGVVEQSHPSSERRPDGVSVAHVPQDPEHDDARLESVHPGLEEQGGGGNKTHQVNKRQVDASIVACITPSLIQRLSQYLSKILAGRFCLFFTLFICGL